MSVTVNEVRIETQIPENIISDAAVTYIIGKVEDDLNLVCGAVVLLLINKLRGRTRIRIGKQVETYDLTALRKQRQSFLSASSATAIDDGFVFDDPFFKRHGI